jgi:hypothetical protein
MSDDDDDDDERSGYDDNYPMYRRDDHHDDDLSDEGYPRDVAAFRDLCRRIDLDEDDEWTCEASLALSDRCAVVLGKALIGNTTLKECCVNIGPNFSSAGVRYLTAGLLGSEIKTFAIKKEDDYGVDTDVLTSIFEIPMQQVGKTKMSKIDTLRLEFHLDDDSAKALGKVLTGNQSIQSLEIDLGNISTAEAAQALAAGLCKSNVTTLKIQDKELGYATAETMEIIYAQGVKDGPTIGKLFVYGNDGGFQALVSSAMPTIHELELQCLSFSPQQVQLLSQALLSSSLENLSLIQCHLKDKDMLILSPALGNCKTLVQLNLKLNYFGDAGIASFAEHWSPESNMEVLDLSMNLYIGPRAVPLLLDALPSTGSMYDMSLAYCTKIGYDGLELIGKALPGKRLYGKLDLEATAKWVSYKDSTSEEALTQANKRDQACKALLEGMRHNVYLTSISVEKVNWPPGFLGELEGVKRQQNR